jgi:hypothetical protein
MRNPKANTTFFISINGEAGAGSIAWFTPSNPMKIREIIYFRM